jgi:hypothetical protein
MSLGILRKKYKQEQAEKIKEIQKERKEFINHVESSPDLETPPREKSNKLSKKLKLFSSDKN